MRTAFFAPVYLLLGIGLILYGLFLDRGAPAIGGWAPGAFRSLSIYVAIVASLYAVLCALPMRARVLTGLVVTLTAMLWAFGPAAVATVGLVLVGATSTGLLSRAEGPVRDDEGSLVVVITIRLAVGLATLVLLGNVISHAPINGPLLYCAMFLAPIAASWTRWRGLLPPVERWTLPDSSLLWLSGMPLVITAAVHLAHAALPELYYDAISYHLPLASYVKTFGEWGYDFTSFVWALYPLGVDWLFTYAYVIGDESSAKLLNGVVMMVAMLLAYRLAARDLGPWLSALLIAACMTAPIMVLLSATLFVEGVFLFLMLGAFVASERLREDRRGWIEFGLLLAALCSTKLYGLVFAAGLAVVALWRVARVLDRGLIIRRTALTASIASLGLVPYLNALAMSGNPVFPFFNAIFRSPAFDRVNFSTPWWTHGWSITTMYEYVFRSPVFIEGRTSGGAGFLWIALGGLGIAGLLGQRAGMAQRAAAVAVAYMAPIGLAIQYTRYFCSVWPLMALALVPGVRLMTATYWHRGTVGVLLVAVMALNLFALPSAGWIVAYFFPARLLAADAHAELRREFVPQVLLTRLVNERERAPTRVAYFGYPAGAHLRGMPIYANWHNRRSQSFEDAPNELALAHAIGREGVKYIIVGPPEPVPPLLAGTLRRYAASVARIGSAELFRLEDNFWLGPELVKNAGFDARLDDWQILAGTAEVSAPSAVVLSNGAVLYQRIPLAPGSRRGFQAFATTICERPGASAQLRVDWIVAATISQASDTRQCAGAGPQTFEIDVTAPDVADVAAVVISSLSGGHLTVRDLSFRPHLQ